MHGRATRIRRNEPVSPFITANSDGSSSDEAADRPLSTPSDFAAKVLVFAVCLAALLAAAASVVVR